MVVVALFSVDLVESVDLVSVDLVVNCTYERIKPCFSRISVFILHPYSLSVFLYLLGKLTRLPKLTTSEQGTISAGSSPCRRKESCLSGSPNTWSAQYAWQPSRIPQYSNVKRDMDCAKRAGKLSKLKTNHVQCVGEN